MPSYFLYIKFCKACEQFLFHQDLFQSGTALHCDTFEQEFDFFDPLFGVYSLLRLLTGMSIDKTGKLLWQDAHVNVG